VIRVVLDSPTKLLFRFKEFRALFMSSFHQTEYLFTFRLQENK